MDGQEQQKLDDALLQQDWLLYLKMHVLVLVFCAFSVKHKIRDLKLKKISSVKEKSRNVT